MREPIPESFSGGELIVLMAEYNPGALSVLMEISINYRAEDIWVKLAIALDDMNIRGPQIWVGFKDFARSNLETFVTAIIRRDAKMIDVINRECPGYVAKVK